MTDTMFVAVMSLVGTLIGSLGGIIASSRLTSWRLQKLEEKVDTHNRVMERTCILERDVARMQKDFESLKGD